MTSVPSNKLVKLPDPLNNNEECKLLAYKTEVMEIVKRFSNEEPAQNLSREELSGIASLKRRCRKEDLVIMETDKSKRLSIMTKVNYIQVTDPHVVNDKVLSTIELGHIEKILNAHTFQLARVFLL